MGAALRIPLDNSLLVVGSDVSGFIAGNALIVQPHIDLLFNGNGGHRGIFLKGLGSLDNIGSSNRFAYIGIGFKTTFG